MQKNIKFLLASPEKKQTKRSNERKNRQKNKRYYIELSLCESTKYIWKYLIGHTFVQKNLSLPKTTLFMFDNNFARFQSLTSALNSFMTEGPAI